MYKMHICFTLKRYGDTHLLVEINARNKFLGCLVDIFYWMSRRNSSLVKVQ